MADTGGSGRTGTFTAEAPTSASAQAVWEVWSDPARWPSWDGAVAEATLAGPFRSGTRGQLRTVDGPVTRFVLRDVEPGVSWVESTKLPLARVRVERRVVAAAGGMLVRHRLSFAGPMGGPWSRLLGRRLGAGLAPTARAVARLAEESSAES